MHACMHNALTHTHTCTHTHAHTHKDATVCSLTSHAEKKKAKMCGNKKKPTAYEGEQQAAAERKIYSLMYVEAMIAQFSLLLLVELQNTALPTNTSFYPRAKRAG